MLMSFLGTEFWYRLQQEGDKSKQHNHATHKTHTQKYYNVILHGVQVNVCSLYNTYQVRHIIMCMYNIIIQSITMLK